MIAILIAIFAASPLWAADTEKLMSEVEQSLRQLSGEVKSLEQVEKGPSKFLLAQIQPAEGDTAVMVDLGPVSKSAPKISIGDQLIVQGYYLNLKGQGLLVARDFKIGDTAARVRRSSVASEGAAYKLDPAIRKNPLWFWIREAERCVGVPSTELISEIAPMMIQRSGKKDCRLIVEPKGNESFARLNCSGERLHQFYNSEEFCRNHLK